MSFLASGILLGVRQESQEALALQIRGEHERSFRGGTQVSAHGKLEGAELSLPRDEAFLAGLAREMREELGDVLADMIEARFSDLKILNEQITTKKTIRTFGLDLGISSEEFSEYVVPGKEVGGFRFVTGATEIRPYREGEKEAGVPPDEVAMFPDEIEAVHLAFESLFKR